MSEVKVCRICLNTKVKLHPFDKYNLKECYEQIMAMKLKNNDGLPKYFCYECAALIHKFYKFKKKCELGQRELKRLIGKGGITLQKVMQIDRRAKKFTTNLNVITVTDRVKTFFKRHKENLTNKNKRKSRESLHITKIDPEHFVEIKVKTEDMVHKEETLDNHHSDNIGDSTDEDICLDEIKEEKTKVKRAPRKITHRKQLSVKKKHPRVKLEKKKRTLDEKNWHLSKLTEEAALVQFQARATDLKYINAVYKCTLCLKRFSKQDMLKRHNKLRHNESNGRIECRFCHFRFKVKSHLELHIREHFNIYKCLRCDLTFCRETSAMHHDEYHNGVTRTCEYCNETFKHLSTYYTHLRKHRSKHVCPVCGESFVSQLGLKLHKSVKHFMETDKEGDAANKKIYCEKCDIKFETTGAYEEHLTHSALHSTSEDLAPPMNLKTPILRRRAKREQTPCSMCNKVFSSWGAYVKHRQTSHPGSRPPEQLAKDNGAGQSQERVVCEICGAMLFANSMYSHLNTHTRERQFACNTCGMKFNLKTTLQRHYLVHTGEKPVECSLCDKRFTQVSSMRLHYRTIHLKQPYPKRNRNKKSEDPEEAAAIAQYYQNKDTAEDYLPIERWRILRL